MKITTTTGLVGFLLALSTLSISHANASVNPPMTETALPTIEQRLAKISQAIKEQEMQIEDSSEATPGDLIAGGWVNTHGGGFVNRHGGGGFVNRHGGGGFVNRPGWRNGGFINHPGWRNGGFVNRPGWRNGGFINR